MQIFSLLPVAFGCIMYGLLTTVVIMVLVYIALRCLSEDIVRGVPFLAAGVLLFFLLNFQFSLMYGAFKAHSYAGELESFVTQMLGDEGMCGAVDTDCAQDVIESVGHRFPILGVYLDGINLPHGNVAEVASSLRISAQKSLTCYIWRRALWSLGFIVVAVLAAMLCEKKHGSSKRSYVSSSSSYSSPDDF